MKTFNLNRVDENHHGDKWQFKIDGGSARLLSPDGETAATFTPDEAFDAVELVHFAKSGHNLAISTTDQAVHFAVWPKAFKGIKAFTELSTRASGSSKLQDLRQSGMVRLIVGGVLFLAGSLLSIDGLLKLSGFGGRGEYYVFYGAIVIGAVFLYQSYYYYAEARRLAKMQER